MYENTPQDVLIDILIRLPIKTLVQFTCVCKSWYSLLTNPNFITPHLNRPNFVDRNDLLIVNRYSKDRNEANYALHRDNKTLEKYAELEFPSKSLESNHFRISGSCNGLLCLSDDRNQNPRDADTLFLWNPTIRKSVALPPYRVGFGSHGFSSAVGFGFDPLTDDYKVIRIVYLGSGHIQSNIDIYTLNARTWRNISHLGLPYYIPMRAPRTYLNGPVHWVASHKSKGLVYYLIVSFSMSDEVFREIKLPDVIARPRWLINVEVVSFRGSLSVLESDLCSDRPSYCLWVMKEYGVAKSWTKHIVVVPDRFWFQALCGL